jgi:secreted PhoX family phosphatase
VKKPAATDLSRRNFVSALAGAAAGTVVAPLATLYARAARANDGAECIANGTSAGFGPLQPALARNAADLTSTVVGDLSNTPLLELPPGFSYTAVSITGAVMSDGSLVPGDHDGMACFPGRDGTYRLVRNHELHPGEFKFGNRAGAQPANGKLYDSFNLNRNLGGGGTTTLVLDRDGLLVRDFASLGGTARNCAGGPTPWRSWISCEEYVATPETNSRVHQRHGYCFEVPADLEDGVDPIPIVDAGRFNHEAAAVDPVTRILYQTEDRSDSCFYRYVSHRRAIGFGDLQDGGSLYAMVIDPRVVSSCDGAFLPTIDRGGGLHSVDTGSGLGSFLGQPLPVRWVLLEDVDPTHDTLRFEAHAKGAALVDRGEGAWYSGRGGGNIYFVATSGGALNRGQVFVYDPVRETVTLVVESVESTALISPDNITVAPDGALYLCEDKGGTDSVVGVDSNGDVFPFLRNARDTGEFAGACFSPNGKFMYVNGQAVGITFAVFRDDRRSIRVHSGWV